jgi:ABC-type multidrug transport system fused ATPase/permease subunit
MSEKTTPIVNRSLLSWIFTRHLKLQVLLVVIVVVAVAARVLPLEMQKRIVNEAIADANFDLLVTYCGVYLVAFITASGLKFFINALQTIIGQRTLADMRKALFSHIVRLPMPFFRNTESGLVVSALSTELATAGDFIGMAVAIPVTNLLTLAAFAGYLFWLNPLLAVVSFSIYPLVLILVPRLQKRVNRYNRKRVDATRNMSAKIGETVGGIHGVKGCGAYRIEDGKFAALTDALKRIRIKWNLYRFGVKVTNNLFTNFSRFLIFALGGYLALEGRLELGALVAFLSAQEKLYDPWKELIRFYQAFQTAAVTYQRTMHYFDVSPETAIEPAQRSPLDLDGRLEVERLSFVTDSDKTLLHEVSFSLDSGRHLALVGFSGSGKSTLANCLVGLYTPSAGSVALGGKQTSELTLRDIRHNIGFVSQNPFVFKGTIEENLLYATAADADDGPKGKAPPQPDLNDRIEALQQAGLFADMLDLGLQATLDTHRDRTHPLASDVIDLRQRFRQKFAEKLADDIEPYHPDHYLYYSSVAENLLFGTPRQEMAPAEWLMGNRLFETTLDEVGLRRPLLKLGLRMADQYLDIFGHISAVPPNLPLTTDELDAHRRSIQRYRTRGLEALKPPDRQRLMKLALRFVPAKHSIASLSDSLAEKILEARTVLADRLPEKDRQTISVYDPQVFIQGASILENIIFGKVKTENAARQNRIFKHVNQLLVEHELLEAILKIGLQFQVGSGGENLSGGQKQKLAIARVLLKKPPVLIMDEATASLDNKSQARVQNMLETRWRGRSTLVAVIHRLDIIKNYDKIAVMKSGRIAEMGTYEELMEKKDTLHALVGKEA